MQANKSRKRAKQKVTFGESCRCARCGHAVLVEQAYCCEEIISFVDRIVTPRRLCKSCYELLAARGQRQLRDMAS